MKRIAKLLGLMVMVLGLFRAGCGGSEDDFGTPSGGNTSNSSGSMAKVDMAGKITDSPIWPANVDAGEPNENTQNQDAGVDTTSQNDDNAEKDVGKINEKDASSDKSGLQSNGAISLGIGRPEISAPIFPQVLLLYEHEGLDFPANYDEELAVVNEVSLGFDDLVLFCQEFSQYNAIRWPISEDAPLEEKVLNFQLIAQCAYEKFTAKPYWIPKLVDDVDICETQLGSDWRMLTVADFESFTPGDYASYNSTHTALFSGMDNFWVRDFFSMHVFIENDAGELMLGDLTESATTRVRTLPAGDPTRHLEMVRDEDTGEFYTVVLRCIR